MSETRKVAVYGSLRAGLGNHGLIGHPLQQGNAKFLGVFKTEPVYTLHHLGGFPGLKRNGNTAVVMEVYEVDQQTGKSIDQLEGYSEKREPTFYDRDVIETPWGNAFTYIYMGNPNNPVESGDWTLEITGQTNYVENKEQEGLSAHSE